MPLVRDGKVAWRDGMCEEVHSVVSVLLLILKCVRSCFVCAMMDCALLP